MSVLDNVLAGPRFVLGRGREAAERADANCSSASAWATSLPRGRSSFPAASSSGWRSPERWQ